MANVIVYPPTSLILSDLVERISHQALVAPGKVRTFQATNIIGRFLDLETLRTSKRGRRSA
jgi:hypothetical protein